MHAVVQRWAEATGVEVEPDAQAKITAGFADEQTRLKMAYDKQGLASAEQQSDLRDALVVEYLYDVRDMKLAKLSKPAAPALNVNRLSDPAPEEITKLIISAPDVISFSPAKFLASFRLIFDNKVGYLDVLSDPDEARITIDDEKKEEFTCRSFVISPGDHTVAVVKPATRVNCAEKVRVNELETATVVCPKGKTKCSLPKKK